MYTHHSTFGLFELLNTLRFGFYFFFVVLENSLLYFSFFFLYFRLPFVIQPISNPHLRRSEWFAFMVFTSSSSFYVFRRIFFHRFFFTSISISIHWRKFIFIRIPKWNALHSINLMLFCFCNFL